MERKQYLTNYYTTHDEDVRLVSRHGSVEFLTTVHYVEKYLCPGMSILEVGAGTGRYSHYFARRGYAVDAIEYMACNIEIFRQNTAPGENITIQQGDAVSLDEVADDRYDITLLLGPMYHLYTEEEQKAALSEAIRVTKPGGVIFAAYCNNDMVVHHFGFLRGGFKAGAQNHLVNFDTFQLASTSKEVFALHRKEDIDRLMAPFPITHLHYLGTDMLTRFMAGAVDAMDDETFALYMKYILTICERPDMVGVTNHMLDIFRKD